MQGSDGQQESETSNVQGWVLGIMGPRVDLETCALYCMWFDLRGT